MPALPADFFELQITQRWKRDENDANGQPGADISAIAIANRLGDGANEPGLIHANHGTHPGQSKRGHGCNANGEIFLTLPDVPVEGLSGQLVEQSVLEGSNDDPGTGPVGGDGQEVVKDLVQDVAAGDGEDENDDGENDTPAPTRHHARVAAQDLEIEGGSINRGGIVGDGAKGQEDDHETAKASETVICGIEQGARGNIIGLCPGGNVGNAGANGDTNDVGENEGSIRSHVGSTKGNQLGRVDGVIDVEVTTDGGEANDAGEHEGEEGDAIGGDGGGITGALVVDIEIATGRADEDEDSNELRDKGETRDVCLAVEELPEL